MEEINYKTRTRISVLGLDSAGKTTMLLRLKTGSWIPDTHPTIGMNVETIIIDNVLFLAWDLHSQMHHRKALWDMHLKNVIGLIYVTDVSDPTRFREACLIFRTLLKKFYRQKLPLAIFANKIDILRDKLELFSPIDFANNLGILQVMDPLLKIFSTSAKTGEGILEGINWLIDTVHKG
jgi:ADP-ribosylation factor-like protein 1